MFLWIRHWLIRRQLKRGNRLARKVAERRGYKLHPKILAKKQSG